MKIIFYIHFYKYLSKKKEKKKELFHTFRYYGSLKIMFKSDLFTLEKLIFCTTDKRF